MTPALAIFFGALLWFGCVSDDFDRAQIDALASSLVADYPGKQVGVGFECRTLAAAYAGAKAMADDEDDGSGTTKQDAEMVNLLRSGVCIYIPEGAEIVTEVARMDEISHIEIWVVDDQGKPMFILRARSPSI